MNIDLSREEVELVIRRFSATGSMHQLDLVELGLVQKLQKHFPPQPSNIAGTNRDDIEVVHKYQQFAQR